MKDLQKLSPWLFGDSYVKRAFAIYGYGIIAHLMVVIGVFVVFFVLGMLSGLLGFIF